ncbi:MAG: response regulator [Thainema sp.]
MTTDSYILLVDDEPQNLLLLEDLLAMEGYTTCSVQSGAEALHRVQQSLPELILLDVMMPEMDGFEVCEQLRRGAITQTIPIIFLTALDDDQSRLKGLEVMGDDYLTKPVQMDLVLTKINSVLRLTKLRQASQQSQLMQQEIRLKQEAREQAKQQMMAAWQIHETLSEKFRLFVPDQFLRRIAPKGVESIQLGNAIAAELTVLFCDIRGFTSIVESQQAQTTFNWLNALFTAINESITQHNGFIDKYLGDAVMAVFDQSETHPMDGLQAAIATQNALAQFNQSRHQFGLEQPIRIGIGLHTGEGVIGTLGASQRMDTTVIGDVVNTASRLEELTKTYGVPIIVSEKTVAALPAHHPFQLLYLDQIVPRGKQQPIQIFQVLDIDATTFDTAKVETSIET